MFCIAHLCLHRACMCWGLLWLWLWMSEEGGTFLTDNGGTVMEHTTCALVGRSQSGRAEVVLRPGSFRSRSDSQSIKGDGYVSLAWLDAASRSLGLLAMLTQQPAWALEFLNDTCMLMKSPFW